MLYKINKIKQLIDINGDSTNFDATFTAISLDGTEFDVLVVDQTTLDNSEDLQYKKAEAGKMSGNIVADKNVYQNYFLILKSDKPCDVNVEINKKEIAPNPKNMEVIPEKLVGAGVGLDNMTQNMDMQQNMEMFQNTSEHEVETKGGFKHWSLIIVLIIVVVGIYFYINKGGKESTSSVTENLANSISSSISSSVPNLSLLSRLNNLQIN